MRTGGASSKYQVQCFSFSNAKFPLLRIVLTTLGHSQRAWSLDKSPMQIREEGSDFAQHIRFVR